VQIYPDKLASHLKQSLASAYLVAGDDALLQSDACKLIRAKAAEKGFNDVQRVEQDNNFSWPAWLASCNELSLFGDQRLLELRLNSSKIGVEGSNAICQYMADPPPDTVLLISAPRVSGKPKWVSTIASNGIQVPIYPLSSEQLPQWLIQRATAHRLKLSRDAAALLAERIEGNLMAAVQELEKLSLAKMPATRAADQATAPLVEIDVKTIDEAVTDNARFSAFDMLDHALKVNSLAACRALAHIREEGQDPAAILGAVAFELRRLATLLEYQQKNQLQAGLKAERIFLANKQATLRNAMARLKPQDLERCIALASKADLMGKRGNANLAFTFIEMILLRLAGQPLATERAVLPEL